MPTELSQAEKDKCCPVTLVVESEKHEKLVNTPKRSRLTDREQTAGYQLRGHNGVGK